MALLRGNKVTSEGETRERARREQVAAERAEDAFRRMTERRSRSNSEQITVLDNRLGYGNGAVRERKRLGAKVKKSA